LKQTLRLLWQTHPTPFVTIVVIISKHCVATPLPQYVSVNNGILLCLDCSKIHAAYVDSISLIKPLAEAAQPDSFKYIQLGGNSLFTNFIQAYGLQKEPPQVKYRTKAAEFYRQRVKHKKTISF
jgi:ADP-ribosylation factor GTPase-activating protein 1